jgi:hypothetical protein
MEVRMQTRIGRSWTALRYDLSSQRALDNAAKMIAEHDRLLAEIDALARRLEAAPPAEQTVEPSAPARSRDVA